MSIVTRDFPYEYIGSREEYSEKITEKRKGSVVEALVDVLLKVRMFYL